MKISYQHPTTKKRTSVTLSNRIFRLWAIVNHFDVTTDDFMYDERVSILLKITLPQHHLEYLNETNNFPTFVSYIENFILLEVENRLLRP